MEASPSLPASEVIYFIPGTPFSPLSSGIITDLINSSLFAPGYSAVIFTLGGEIDGTVSLEVSQVTVSLKIQ